VICCGALGRNALDCDVYIYIGPGEQKKTAHKKVQKQRKTLIDLRRLAGRLKSSPMVSQLVISRKKCQKAFTISNGI
jgi:hypothetical protein